MRTHLDLCSGIGGFALAARWSGYDTIGFCEIDPWCRRVIAKNFPGVPQHDDLWTLSAETVRGWIGATIRESASSDANSDRRGFVRNAEIRHERDGRRAPLSDAEPTDQPRLGLITGGYPCQPFSLAGKRLGAEDDRHLWPAIAALVAELRPARCLFENVAGHITMGLDDVLADMEALGYACQAIVVPAAAVGAPHRRDRVWILADAECGGRWEPMPIDAAQGSFLAPIGRESASGVGSSGADVSDANSRRLKAGYAGDRIVSITDTSGANAANTAINRSENVVLGHRVWKESTRSDRTEAELYDETLSRLGQSTDGVSGQLDDQSATGPDHDDRGEDACLSVRELGRRWQPDPRTGLNPWADDWEQGTPRVVADEAERGSKLKALGNAIVPQVAYEILRAWDDVELEAA